MKRRLLFLVCGLATLLVFLSVLPPSRLAMLAEGVRRDFVNQHSWRQITYNLTMRIRYDRFKTGDFEVGDPAPDVTLLGLDGKTRFRLSDLLSGRPMVLIFGSYT